MPRPKVNSRHMPCASLHVAAPSQCLIINIIIIILIIIIIIIIRFAIRIFRYIQTKERRRFSMLRLDRNFPFVLLKR